MSIDVHLRRVVILSGFALALGSCEAYETERLPDGLWRSGTAIVAADAGGAQFDASAEARDPDDFEERPRTGREASSARRDAAPSPMMGAAPSPRGGDAVAAPFDASPETPSAMDASERDPDATPPEPNRCGNGRIDNGERCDIALAAPNAGACPRECPPLAECAPQRLEGADCQARCEPASPACTDGDGCCPSMCNAGNDDDCSPTCGDGIVQEERGETCEPGTQTPCLTEADCNDDDPCTRDTLFGNASNCNTTCIHLPIGAPRDDDGCCPVSSEINANNDNDCEPRCGNGVPESGEECDGEEYCSDCTRVPTAEQERCLSAFSGDDCRACECMECTQAALDCFDSGDATRDMHCATVAACSRASGCAREDDCYCRSALLCRTPDGACVEEIEAAADAADGGTADITQALQDQASALYRAEALGQCRIDRCAQLCP